MKTTNVLVMAAMIAASLFVNHANAKIWRVNNKSNFNGTSLYGDNFGGTSTYPVFKEINEAVNWAGVNDNDTLYVEGSTSVYATASITKKLVVIGPGYFLSENPKTSNDLLEAQIGQIAVNASGSQIIGMSNISSGSFAYFYVNVNNVTIKRCKLTNTIEISSNLTDVYILENFFLYSGNALSTNGSFYVYPIDLYFNNNICLKTLIWAGQIQQCNNNVFDGPASVLNLQFTTPEFSNNILKATNASVNINGGNLEKVTYNIGTLSTQFGTANNNIVVANMTNLFVQTGTDDGKYQLKTNSAGSNNGSDGADRGAFGGAVASNRYTLSGLAAVPVVYNLITSGVATSASGLSVTISARTIK
ncbi:MAG: hypothetical protein JO072_13985 [Parafilimonas sp.]|nr:hypothetical protein [Parafilimonas sp.]